MHDDAVAAAECLVAPAELDKHPSTTHLRGSSAFVQEQARESVYLTDLVLTS